MGSDKWIRVYINQGKVLGSTRFQQEIEELVGRSVGINGPDPFYYNIY